MNTLSTFLQGNRRFRKLFETAGADGTSPPADLRYLLKPRATDRNHEVRADAVSFLANVYTSIAETLPDVRDDPLSTEEELSLQKPCSDTQSDPYAQKMEKVLAGEDELPSQKGGKRKRKKGIEINPLRADMEQKFLPPGCMKDYWEQYCLQSTLTKPASFPTFWRARRMELRHFLMFSSYSLGGHIQSLQTFFGAD